MKTHEALKLPENIGDVSDGHHTFNELYAHRVALFAALCRCLSEKSWKSKFHDDGTTFEGWFIAGIGTEQGKMITYHAPLSAWDDFYGVTVLERAPEFDGHTSGDVLNRLKNL